LAGCPGARLRSRDDRRRQQILGENTQGATADAVGHWARIPDVVGDGRRSPADSRPGGEVRVRVLASSVEYTDVLIQRHLYPQTESL
jgi:hypothetical protein